MLKVIVTGDGAVGKTTLIRRFVEGKFEASRVATIGVDFHTHTIRLPGKTVKLSIWDMAGQERFQVMRKGFYRGSRSAALVFDVTQPRTLANLVHWRREVLEAVPRQAFVVIGNKIDLERTIPSTKAKAYADSIGAPYLETSALTGENVAALFETMARLAAKT